MDITDIIANIPSWLQILLAIAVISATIWMPLPKMVVVVVRWFMYSIKPRRKNWVADCVPTQKESGRYGQPDTNANNAWRKDTGRWTSGYKQQIDDWFTLKLDKPRYISKIRITSEGRNFPSKFKLQTKRDDKSDWVEEGEKEVQLNDNGNDVLIEHKFGKKRKIHSIRMITTEPTLTPLSADNKFSPAWNIHSIDPSEYMLFGCIWEREIG